MTDTVGLSQTELRKIADTMDRIVATLGKPEDWDENLWKWGVRVDVDFDGILYGTISPHGDGWWQFTPNAEN